MSEVKILNELLNKTLTSCVRYDDIIVFVTSEGERFRLCHEQDCCESVYIEDIAGDLNDLVGAPLSMAEEVSNADDPPVASDYSPDSYTWTYFKFATIKGYVTIRFYGTSNGYYSESAHLYRIDKNGFTNY